MTRFAWRGVLAVLLTSGVVQAQDAVPWPGLRPVGPTPAAQTPSGGLLPAPDAGAPVLAPAPVAVQPMPPLVAQVPPGQPNPYVIPCAADVPYSTGGASVCPSCACPSEDACAMCGCDGVGSWRDNVEIWLLGDGFRDIGDVVGAPGGSVPAQANFGLQAALNSAFALGERRIRGQIGGSVGVFNLQGRNSWFAHHGIDSQTQAFFTAGVYDPGCLAEGDCLAWGLVYDQFLASNWGVGAQGVSVGQLHGLVSWAVSECDAFGAVVTVGLLKDDGVFTMNGFGDGQWGVETMNYVKLFWTRHFAFGGETSLFVGGCNPSQVGTWLFGFEGRAPLSSFTALTTGFTYVSPGSSNGAAGNSEETWNLSAGVVFYLGGKAVARDVTGRAGLPLVDVADNASLIITRRD